MDETSGRSEQVTARFGSRVEAEAVAARLKEIGIAPAGITVRTGAEASNPVKQRLHIGEGLILGAVVGSLLGGLFGAIFSQPQQTLSLMGNLFHAEVAGAITGIGYGLALGLILGVFVGVLARNSTVSPLSDFEDRISESAFIDVQVPAALAGRARDIVNAS